MTGAATSSTNDLSKSLASGSSPINQTASSPLSNSSSNNATVGSKKSLKLIDKSQATNFQLYPIRLNTTTDKLDSIGTLVSVNYIYNNSSNVSNSSRLQRTDTNSQINIFSSSNNSGKNSNVSNLNTSRNYNGGVTVNANGNVQHHWNDESNSGWTGTGVMSDRSSVYSIDDGVFILVLLLIISLIFQLKCV